MQYTGIVHEHTFDKDWEELKKEFPRIDEFVECAEWQIGRNYEVFLEAFSTSNIKIQVWRSDPDELGNLPTIEIAYYYDANDERVHFLGIRSIPPEPKEP